MWAKRAMRIRELPSSQRLAVARGVIGTVKSALLHLSAAFRLEVAESMGVVSRLKRGLHRGASVRAVCDAITTPVPSSPRDCGRAGVRGVLQLVWTSVRPPGGAALPASPHLAAVSRVPASLRLSAVSGLARQLCAWKRPAKAVFSRSPAQTRTWLAVPTGCQNPSRTFRTRTVGG